MSFVDKLAWICITDRRLLVARSKNKDLFYLPGGKREVGESDQQALTREIAEELSVILMPDTVEYVETFTALADGKTDGTHVQMTCYRAEFSGTLQAAAEIAELAWVTSLDHDRCSLVAKIIVDWLKTRDQID